MYPNINERCWPGYTRAMINESFCAEYKAVLNAMTVKPIPAYSSAYNKMVKGMIQAGSWNKIKAFYFFATHDRQSALLNWKNIGFRNPTQNNTPVFTPFKGFKGISSTSSFVKTNFIPSTDGLSVNNSGVIVGIMDDVETAGRFGAVTSSNSYLRIAPRFDANGTSYFDLNDANGGNSLGLMLNSSKKHFGIMRNISTGFDAYVNYAKITKVNSASTETVSIAPFVGCNNGQGSPSFYDNNRHYSYVIFSESLTEIEYIKTMEAIEGCLTVTGNPIIPSNPFNLVIDGHSFTYAAGSGQFPDQVLGNTNNLGRQSFGTLGAQISRLVEHQSLVDACIKPGKTNVLVIWIGVNDVGDTLGAGTIAYNAMKPYLLNRKAAGFNHIFVFTMTPSTLDRSSIFESERVIFNNLMRNDLALNEGIYVMDTDTVPELADPSNTTYYVDKLHPTAMGAKKAAQLLYNKLAELHIQ